MKKSVLIVVLVMGFGMVSCEKHECKRNSENTEAPTWRAAKTDGRDGGISGHGGTVVDTGGSITDPNDDQDGNGRKKR